MVHETQFWLQIVDKHGKVAHLPGGGPLELDLVQAVALTVDQTLPAWVWPWSRKTRQEQIAAAVSIVLMGLKNQTVMLAHRG